MIGPSRLGCHEDARYKSPHVQILHMYSITDTQRETVAAKYSHVLSVANVIQCEALPLELFELLTPIIPATKFNPAARNKKGGGWVLDGW